jgi:hypothetical protein
MSDPAKPSDPTPDDAPNAVPSAEGSPAPTPPSQPADAAPLEVMPEAARLPGDGAGQELVAAPQPPPAPGPAAPPPIDYAMPSQPKSWLPSPALVRNFGCIFKMLVGFAVMLGMGYFMLMALNPKARQWALQGKGGDGPGPTPFRVVNQVLALPAQALAKTDDVVKANNARAGVVDGLVSEEEKKTRAERSRTVVNPFASGGAAGPEKAPTQARGATGGAEAEAAASDERAALAERMMALAEQQAANPTAPKADAVRPTAIATRQGEVLPPMTLPGGIVIQSVSPEGAPPAGRAFFYWVVNASISGISPGPPARVLVANRLTYEGTEVHIPLGIVFERLDPAKKLLYFRDQSGAVVTRSY